MKYLIQNRKEFAITVVAFVMAVINLIRSIREGVFTSDNLITVILTAIGVLAWYYNMPTSEENCIATGEMRARKQYNKGGVYNEQIGEIEEEGENDDSNV